MKKQMNSRRMHRWTAFLLVIVLVSGIFSPSMEVHANPYSGGDSNCTSTAWRLAYENTGIQLPAWSHAHTWYNSARNAGYTVSTVPRAKSIAVWSGGTGGLGHVAYVSQVSGDQIYIQEGGYEGKYHEGWENAYGQTKYYHLNYLTMIGYIYLGDTKPTIPSGYLNAGQSFDAAILRTDVWRKIAMNDGNVELASESEYKSSAKQFWHFERQGDGSYIITNLYDGRYLDVSGGGTANGTNVRVFMKWGDNYSAQRWYIYGNQNARRLVPKNAPDKCLDCAGGSALPGTNLQIWEWNQSAAQVFSIYELEKKVPTGVKDSDYSLEIGETRAITASVEPADSGYNDLIYSVEDETIATVEDGKLTGITQGSTRLTITSAYSDKLKCTVNVNVIKTDTKAPTVKVEIKEVKEDKIIVYVEAEDDKIIKGIGFQSLDLGNCLTRDELRGLGGGAIGGKYEKIESKSFSGEIELPLNPKNFAGDEHELYVSVGDESSNYTRINVPFSWPGGKVRISMKTGEKIDEQEVLKKLGNPQRPSEYAGFGLFATRKTVDLVSYTPGTKTGGITDNNGYFIMDKPGIYGLVFADDINGREYPATFVITCGHENVQARGAGAADCTTAGYTGDMVCCDCNEVLEQGSVIPAKGHAWGLWKTIREAGCVNAGERQRTCKNCDETEKKTVNALGHTVVTDKAVLATTTSTGLTEGSHCSVCGKVLRAQKTVPKVAKDTKPKKPTVTKPKAPTVKLSTKKKTVQVKISKVKGASGYEIYRSRAKSSGFKKITSTKKTSYTNKGLTAKKTYYYKVRAYKTVKGKKLYGNWSKVLKIKVKK